MMTSTCCCTIGCTSEVIGCPRLPTSPIVLPGAALRWHGELDDPPAAAQRARDADELADRRAQLVSDRAERTAKDAAAAMPDARAAAEKYFFESGQNRHRGGNA